MRPDPSLDGHEGDAPRFVEGLDRSELDRVGIRIEDKGAIVALHWRGAENEGAAESVAHEIASEAEWQGLIAHRGRKVLEIRPNVAINKGIAVAALIPARPVDAALYGGDDRTDVDAFTALRTLRDDGRAARHRLHCGGLRRITSGGLARGGRDGSGAAGLHPGARGPRRIGSPAWRSATCCE